MDILEKIKTESIKIVGFSTENEYNLLLKKIYETLSPFNPLIIDGGFKVPRNTDVIISVQKSIPTLNLDNLQPEDLIITNETVLNKKIQDAIITILQPLLKRTFSSQIQKNNFFVKHIVWIFERIQELDFFNNPVLFYYGDTTEDDEIHLQILYKMGCRLIFVNPRMNTNNPFYNKLNFEGMSFLNYCNPEKLMTRIAKAKEEIIFTNVIQTVAKKAKNEFHETVYNNSNYVFTPWQFKQGYTIPIYIDAVIEDIKTYWNQDARFREGFKVKIENNQPNIYLPNFFTKVNGVSFDKLFYKDLVNLTKNSPLTLFKTSTTLIEEKFSKEDMFSLMFVMTYDKVDFEKVKKHKLYNLSIINTDSQIFIINKFNEFMERFKNYIQQIDLIKMLACVITCDIEYIKLIENFDYPFRVPKLVIYLQDRDAFDLKNSLFIHFLNMIGIDIIIYSTTGSESIENYLFDNYLNIITLEEMKDGLSYDILNSYKNIEQPKKGFFMKIFG